MKGQWIGKSNDDKAKGTYYVNIDEHKDCFQGIGYIIEDNRQMPASIIVFRTLNKDKEFTFTGNILPIDPKTGHVTTWENVKHLYPNVKEFPLTAAVNGNWDENKLDIDWKTSNGESSKVTLPKSKASEPSQLVPNPSINSWEHYKTHVSEFTGLKLLFRGQSNNWRLRTAFHRTGRADILRFANEEVPTVRRHLVGKTKHFFNLNNADENGAFYNLLQHHGYPTPLLDWSYSPYVAAFFAYRNITKQMLDDASPTDNVRIFIFDYNLWIKDWLQINSITTVAPHVSVQEFISLENPRSIPQQSVSTITNLDDIETYITSKKYLNHEYLFAIDLPLSERGKVMCELRYMGITAGSLFPGLDGACEELKERNFEF